MSSSKLAVALIIWFGWRVELFGYHQLLLYYYISSSFSCLLLFDFFIISHHYYIVIIRNRTRVNTHTRQRTSTGTVANYQVLRISSAKQHLIMTTNPMRNLQGARDAYSRDLEASIKLTQTKATEKTIHGLESHKKYCFWWHGWYYHDVRWWQVPLVVVLEQKLF